MKKVYTSPDRLMVNHLKNILHTRGIDCAVRNEHLASALGELPPIECWPELWVLDDAQGSEAQDIITKALIFAGPVSKPWTCAECGEAVEGQFTHCWQCGRSRPG